jgi:hypothetical protein
MMQRSFMILTAIAATVGFAGTASAIDDDLDDLTPAEIQALRGKGFVILKRGELEALVNRVDRLEGRGTAVQARAADVAITDASQRSQFPQGDKLVTGWDKGFKLGSADGNYLIQPYVDMQFRNVTNWSKGIGEFDSDVVNGFELRRVRAGVKGNVISPDLKYNFRLSIDRGSGEAYLDYAYAEYQFADDWGIRLGQYKLNWAREETVSATRQLAAERSLFNQILGGANTMYVQGVTLLYGSKDNPFRGELAYTDGDDTANTTFQDVSGDYWNFGIAGRGEYKVYGDWDAYSDFTAMKTKNDLLVVGGGFDWSQGGDGDVYRFTADAQWENPGGWGVYGAVNYTLAKGDIGEAFLDKAFGGLAQVGYLLPGEDLRNYEAFGRLSAVKLDEEVNGDDFFWEATVGLNRYFSGHNAKLTVDLNWLPEGTPVGASGLGYNNNTDEQIVLRTQFQLAL